MINDYSISGDFGEVKLFDTVVASGAFRSLDSVSRIGWHKVNERYRISRPNGTDHDLIIMTLAGRGELLIDGARYTAEPDTIAVLPARAATAYGGVKGEMWEFYWFHYCGDHASACTEDITRNRQYIFISDRNEQESLFRPLCGGDSAGIEREIAESAALSRLLGTLLLRSAAPELKHKEKTVVDEMTALLSESINSEFSLDMLAKRYHYSKEHIIRIFKKATGMSPYRYRQQLRFKQCRAELECTNRPISEIAAQFGYESSGGFSKQFKEEVGVSPAKYRKTYGYFQN